jgi:phosphatidate cytidylyltransferase
MKFVSLWADPLYRQTVLGVFAGLCLVGLCLFFVRNKNPQTQAGWASVKSWIIATPVLLGFMGLMTPWPLIVLVLIAIWGAKTFFQMTGIYHRSYFVWLCYAACGALAFCIHNEWMMLYNMMPMIVLGAACLVPILRNSSKRMIQYICLTLLGFSFVGWCFMHIGWLWQMEGGPYMVIYIIILTEVCDNLYLGLSGYVGKIRLFNRITARRNLESFLISAALTFALAFGLRHLLPDRHEIYWIASALVATLGGSMGDLVLSVIRRDLGVKDVGVFIIGRGDLLTIIDRLIFVAPIYFYVMHLLLKMPL